MCRVPFKEHCIRFWPLNGSFKNISGRPDNSEDMIYHNEKAKEFDVKNKCLKIQSENSYIRLSGKHLKEPFTLIFQTRDLQVADECHIHDHKFMDSNDPEVDVYSFDFLSNIKLLKSDKWITHVVIYEKNRTTYYMDGMLVSIRESGLQHQDIVLNDSRMKDRIVCTGSIRNIGLYEGPFTYRMVKGLNYFDFYSRSVVNMAVNWLIRKQDGECQWT